MSSHHVIRDEQEPPVFILDIENNINDIKQLLGWSPSVWAIEEHTEWLMSQNVKVDGVLCTHPESHIRLNQQSGEYLIEKFNENNLLEGILQITNKKDYTGINIFCNKSQKRELILAVKELYFSLPMTIFTDNEVTIVTFNKRFKKWYPENQKLKILSGILLSAESLKGSDGIYQLEKEGLIQLNAEPGPIIITEC